MLITILMFIFFKILFIFFWQIWCENRKFLKLTEISQRGTLLDAYYDLNVYFFKIFIIHNFWANLVRKFEVLQINWNLVYAYYCFMLIMILCSFFSTFFSVMFFRQIWSQNQTFFKLTEICCRGTLLQSSLYKMIALGTTQKVIALDTSIKQP